MRADRAAVVSLMALLFAGCAAATPVRPARPPVAARATAAPKVRSAERVREPAPEQPCASPPPALRVEVQGTFGADDLQQIERVLKASKRTPVISIAELSPAISPTPPSPGADLLVRAMVFGGHDRCRELGRNTGSLLERVNGRWRLLGRRGSIVEHVR